MDIDAFLARVKQQALDAERLRRRLALAPTDRVLNVHTYGWPAYEAFMRKFYSDGRPRVLALSMNPGPFGAVQTGIPFCDAPMARSFLPDFDRLVDGKPSWATAERTETSAKKLIEWSDARFGGITGLYDRMLLAMTCPLAILRGPNRVNVPLPALPRSEQKKIEEFIARHAAAEIRIAAPTGIFLLGEWAGRVWELAQGADPTLGRLRAVAVPHPAAHITNGAKYAAWTGGYQQLARPVGKGLKGSASGAVPR